MTISEKRKEYLIKNRVHIKECRKKYAQLDKEKERKRKWYIEHPNRNKEYYEKNREVLLKKAKTYHLENREERNKQSMKWKNEHPDYGKNYRKEHCKEILERMKLWTRIKIKTDMKFNINQRVRSEVNRSLKGNKNGRHWETLVGYTLADLVKHLKKTIPKGYTWAECHIDHIIPISAFNYDKPENPDFKKCWALFNLRLLPIKENLTKGSKLDKPFQPSLKISIVEGV